MEKFVLHAFQNPLRLLFEFDKIILDYIRDTVKSHSLCWCSRLRNEIKKLSKTYCKLKLDLDFMSNLLCQH